MSAFDIASKYTIPFFSKCENAGGALGTLSIWKRGPTIKVNDRDAAGPLVPVLGIIGTASPKESADLDITENAGRRREGDIEVTTIAPLQLDDEATGETSWFILHKGYYYAIDTEDAWHYAGGNVYQAFRDRRQSGV